MNVDTAESFRARLSAELRTAMIKRDHESISTIRCIMAAIDNAGAVAQETATEFMVHSSTEVARRRLDYRDIVKILQNEIDAREMAALGYERTGDTVQAVRLRDSAAMIGRWMALLTQSLAE